MNKPLLILPITTVITITAITLTFFNFSALATNNGSQLPPDNFRVEGRNLVQSPIDNYYAKAQNQDNTLTSIRKSDSRPVIIDNFLAKHNSPMRGLGSTFVSVADKYGIDYRLIPAIAFQESTLGRNMPKNSHNAWGWAIYTGATSGAKFHDWQFAIETVAKGIKTDYIDRGLNTPEAIRTRYT